MQNKFAVIFGGAIAGTLLFLYAFALTYMSVLVYRAGSGQAGQGDRILERTRLRRDHDRQPGLGAGHCKTGCHQTR